MPYCYYCGVEVDEKIRRCPLCEKRIILEENELASYPYPTDAAPFSKSPPLTPTERFGLARNITTLGFLIPLLVILATDYVVSGGFVWSPIPVISLVMVWGLAMLPLYFPEKPSFIIWGSTLIVAIFLFILENILHKTWFFTLGLPLIGSLGLCTWLVVKLCRSSKRSGYRISAAILGGIISFCLLCDMFINIELTGHFGIGWSLILTGAIAPIIVLMLYLSIFPNRKNFLKRFFHI